MIDYIEGVIRMNQMMKQLHEQLLAKQYVNAKETCQKITAESRLVFNQIKIQENDLS